MVKIAKPVNGITINGNEYVLDDNGKAKTFKDEKTARLFLHQHGISDQNIKDMLIDFVKE